MKKVQIKVAVDAKEIPAIGKFDYTGTLELPEKLDEAVTVGGSEDVVVTFIQNAMQKVAKARCNFWRQYEKDSKETKETLTSKFDEVFSGNMLVALRGAGDTTKAKEAIAYQDTAKSLKARYEAQEISLDEFLAGI